MKQAKRNGFAARHAARLQLSYLKECSAETPRLKQFERWCLAALESHWPQAQLSLSIVDAVRGQQLNHEFRGKDYPTNVLSFALNEGEEQIQGLPLIGDIVFCSEVVAREAAEQGKSLEAHYAHLTIHGMLHLQGYDHIEDAEAEAMEALERRLLARLGYPDPYASEHA